jgi:cell division protein FtsQ
LRSIAEGDFRIGMQRVRRRIERRQGTAPFSWYSAAKEHADCASRVGFVLSMLFLASAAIYGFSLSNAATPALSEIGAIADRVAFEAGFRFEDLAISGVRNTPRALLMKALSIPPSKSSLSFNTFEAHDRLMGIGWVGEAEVRRVLPNRLEVSLTERAPFARWADPDNNIKAIDRDGRLLGPDGDGRFGDLLLFSGEGARLEAADFIDALANHDDLRRRIERTELIAERFWLLKLENGLNLKLPRKVNAIVLDRLESILANSRIAALALNTIDLRLSHRTILQLREPTLVARDSALASLMPPSTTLAPARKGSS